MIRNCPNRKACKVCELPGHEPGSPRCPYYTINGGMRIFGGAGDPLSNHYKCDFEYNDVKVESVEHSWFNQKATKNGQEGNGFPVTRWLTESSAYQS